MFRDIHNFFVRSERCRKLYDNPKCYDWLRKNLEAWILGLPRTQRDPRTRIDTGYRIKIEDVDRRASPIIVSCHRGSNRFGDGVFVTFILSADWPTEMKWTGLKRNRANKTIEAIEKDVYVKNEVNIISAMNTALREFENFVEKARYSLEKVWP
jgi:hypothetical protein